MHWCSFLRHAAALGGSRGLEQVLVQVQCAGCRCRPRRPRRCQHRCRPHHQHPRAPSHLIARRRRAPAHQPTCGASAAHMTGQLLVAAAAAAAGVVVVLLQWVRAC